MMFETLFPLFFRQKVAFHVLFLDIHPGNAPHLLQIRAGGEEAVEGAPVLLNIRHFVL